VTSRIPFETVLQRHGPTVLRVCRAVAGPADADDAWQETFLAALRAYPELDPAANLEAWLVRIAHRKSIDQRRAATRRTRLAAALTPPPEPAESHLDWADVVSSLPPRQRQAVVYHHVAGLPYQEVADLIGGTPAAVRRAAADGIAALRTRLAPTRPSEVPHA